MRYYISIIIFLLSFNLHAEILKSEWQTPKENMPSCMLYRKRMINYVQRLNELEIAHNLKHNKLSMSDTIHLYELGNRVHIPLHIEDTTIFYAKILVPTKQREIFSNGKMIEVDSKLLKWVSTNFDLPESAARYHYQDGILELEIEQNYFQACLVPDVMTINFSNDIQKYQIILKLDKYNWDLEN